MRGALGEELRRTPGLTLKPAVDHGDLLGLLRRPVGPEVARGTTAGCGWPRTYAIDRQAINQAETLGLREDDLQHHPRRTSSSSGSRPPSRTIRPGRSSSSPRPATPTDSTPGTSPATPCTPACGEPVANDLQAAGIRVKLRPLERAAYNKGQVEKTFKNLVLSGERARSATPPTRLEAFVVAGGAYVYGSYPDIDGLFREQARRARPQAARGDRCTGSSSSIHEKAMFAPIWQLGDGRLRAAGGGVRARAHHRLSVLRPLRGPEAQEGDGPPGIEERRGVAAVIRAQGVWGALSRPPILEQRAVRLEAEHGAPHRLVVHELQLVVAGDHLGVARVALQRAAGEDRGGARRARTPCGWPWPRSARRGSSPGADPSAGAR